MKCLIVRPDPVPYDPVPYLTPSLIHAVQHYSLEEALQKIADANSTSGTLFTWVPHKYNKLWAQSIKDKEVIEYSLRSGKESCAQASGGGVRSNIRTFRKILQHSASRTGIKRNPAELDRSNSSAFPSVEGRFPAMTRPLRLEFAGATYHITSRGDRREDIYLNDDDRCDWLDVLGNACQRFNWVVHAFCQMSNHYHLLLETVDGNLARGMRQLNGEYTQGFNRRHVEDGVTSRMGSGLTFRLEDGVRSNIPTFETKPHLFFIFAVDENVGLLDLTPLSFEHKFSFQGLAGAARFLNSATCGRR